MQFNINNYVRVRLTDHGREIHQRNHFSLLGAMPSDVRAEFPYVSPKEDQDGWSEWQLWHLMREFGPWIRMTGEPPFSTLIEVTEKPL